MSFVCEICGKISKNQTGFGLHLRKSHNITRNEHYLKYEEHKFCKKCGKILSVYQGMFCSQRCSALEHIELAKEACRGDKHWLRNLDNPNYFKSEQKRKEKIGAYMRSAVKKGTHGSLQEHVKRKIKKTIKQGFKEKKYKRCTKEFAEQARKREKRKIKQGKHTFQIKAKEIQIKHEQTMLKRYGVRNPAHVPEFVKKRSGENHPHWKGGISYRNYGKDWPCIRKFILARDDQQCVICKTKKRIEVHHLTPISSGINIDLLNDPFNLISLCKRHHKKQEWTNCYEKEIVEYLNNWGKFVYEGRGLCNPK